MKDTTDSKYYTTYTLTASTNTISAFGEDYTVVQIGDSFTIDAKQQVEPMRVSKQ